VDVGDLVQADRDILGRLVVPVPGDDPVPAVAERRDQGEGLAGGVVARARNINSGRGYCPPIELAAGRLAV
jgi:hypothetical protein